MVCGCKIKNGWIDSVDGCYEFSNTRFESVDCWLKSVDVYSGKSVDHLVESVDGSARSVNCSAKAVNCRTDLDIFMPGRLFEIISPVTIGYL